MTVTVPAGVVPERHGEVGRGRGAPRRLPGWHLGGVQERAEGEQTHIGRRAKHETPSWAHLGAISGVVIMLATATRPPA